MSRLSLNEGKGARSPRIDRVMPRIFSKRYSWNDIGPVMDADSVVVGYVFGLEPNKGPVFFSKRPTIGTRMVDSNIVDKFGLPVWVEDGAQFSAGDIRRFVGVQDEATALSGWPVLRQSCHRWMMFLRRTSCCRIWTPPWKVVRYRMMRCWGTRISSLSCRILSGSGPELSSYR